MAANSTPQNSTPLASSQEGPGTLAVLRNNSGDNVVVVRGGFGFDNMVGTVTDRAGGLIGKARVEIFNRTNESFNEGKTDGAGRFDLDVNAAAGHDIFIHVSWTDSGGARRVISGSFTSN